MTGPKMGATPLMSMSREKKLVSSVPEQIAGHGAGKHHASASRKPLKKAQGNEFSHAFGAGAQKRGDNEYRKGCEQRLFSASGIAERTEHYLPEGKTEQTGRDAELHL